MNLKKLKRKLERRLKQIPINDFIELYLMTIDEVSYNRETATPTDLHIGAIKLMKRKDIYNNYLGSVACNLIYFRKDNKVIDNIKDIELRTLLRGAK